MKRLLLTILCLESALGLFATQAGATPFRPAADSSSVTILANVDSAAVFIDSTLVGITPLRLDSLSPGIHRIRLFHPDIANWLTGSVKDTFSVRAGESRVLRYIIPVFGDTSAGKSLVLRPTILGSESVFQNSYGSNSGTLRLYISGGAAVLTGVATAYFKIRADNRYDDFLSTNNVLLRSESRRFDTAAAIFLVATQLGLAFFIYYLLSG